MTTSLRPATALDAPRIADILIGTRSAFMPYAPSAHTEAEDRAWVRDTLVPGGGVTVSDRGGEVLGLVATAREADVSWVMHMAVDPRHVGHGIGTTLLHHAIRSLPRPIRLWTFQPNLGARRFYERHGFKAILFTDGEGNEERCPDVLYELRAARVP